MRPVLCFPQEEPPSKPSEGPDKKPLSEKVDSLLWSGVVVRPTQIIGRISEIVKKLPDDLQITRVSCHELNKYWDECSKPLPSHLNVNFVCVYVYIHVCYGPA